jgi:hypothetical protein
MQALREFADMEMGCHGQMITRNILYARLFAILPPTPGFVISESLTRNYVVL